jgi:hypothetical protein
MISIFGICYVDFTDPLSNTCYWNTWIATAIENGKIYDKLEGSLSVDKIFNFNQYREATRNKEYVDATRPDIKELLERIKGHLVLWPINYLKDEDMSPSIATKVILPTPLWV